MWEFENDKWIDNCIWNSVDNDWLKIVVIRFKNIKICMTIIVIHIIFTKIEAAEQSKLKMLIFATWLLSHDQHIVVYVISAKIEAAELKTSIFAA